MATITTIANKILGKKTSWAYQLTHDEIEYVIAAYYKYGRASCTPYFARWNLSDPNAPGVLIDGTGKEGGEVYPVCYANDWLNHEVLGNNRLAHVNRNYYMEIDLATGQIAYYHLAAGSPRNVWRTVCQGINGKVVIASGTVPENMWLSWCDPGGANWGEQRVTKVLEQSVFFGDPCSMLASDGDNYVYGSLHGKNYVIAINIRTGDETLLSVPGTNASTIQYTVGETRKIYIYVASVGYYEVNGTVIGDLSHLPLGAVEYHQRYNATTTGKWFSSEGIEVDKTDIEPNADGVVSLSYSGVTKSVSGILPDVLGIDLITPSDPNGKAMIQAVSYGPWYTLQGDEVEFLGYPYSGHNCYGCIYSPNLGGWPMSGYDKMYAFYDPAQRWDQNSLTTAAEALTTNPRKIYISPATLTPTNSDDHWLFPIEGADKKIYTFVRSRGRLLWYDHAADTWGALDLIGGTITQGSGAAVQFASALNDCDIQHIGPMMGGYAIAISSRDQDVSAGNYFGRLRIFDVLSQKIRKVLTIVENADSTLANIGITVEVGTSLTDNGHVIAVRGNLASDSKAWRINTHAIMPSAVVWEVDIAGNAFNGPASEYCHLEIGPNGLIYLMVGTVLNSLNPAAGQMLPVTVTGGSIPAGSRLRWQGNRLVAYGVDTNLYPIAGII